MEKILITKAEYERLLDRDEKLTALEEGGVDNWEWYEESLKDYYQRQEEDERREEIEDKISEKFDEMISDLEKSIYEPSTHGTGFCFEEEAVKKAKETVIDMIMSCISETEDDNEDDE